VSEILSLKEFNATLWNYGNSVTQSDEDKRQRGTAIRCHDEALRARDERRLKLLRRAGGELFVLLASFPEETDDEEEEMTVARLSLRALVKDINDELGETAA